MNLSTKLTQLRKAKGLSQDDLAEKLNLSRQAVYKWETGQSTPDIDNLRLLSSIYNITVDNLLNDNEELQYKGEAKKISYGKPTVIGTPSSDSAERDNTTLLPEDAKKAKIRKIVTWVSFCITMFIPLSFVFPFAMGETPVSYDIMAVLLIMGLVALPVWLLTKKFLYANVYFDRNYLKKEKARNESVLQSKGYTYVALQHDLLQWFYFNPNDKTFGFYFDEKEQFVCPIQNYVDFTYPQEGDKAVKVGKQYGVGVMVGSLNGVGIQSTNKMVQGKQMNFFFNLKYYDETGVLSNYKFSLFSHRKYCEKFSKDAEDMQIYFDTVSISTKGAYDKIVEVLEIEKSKSLV